MSAKLLPTDPTREDSRICRVEGCNRPKAHINTVSMVRRFTVCRRHLTIARVEEK